MGDPLAQRRAPHQHSPAHPQRRQPRAACHAAGGEVADMGLAAMQKRSDFGDGEQIETGFERRVLTLNRILY
jgi:hypothetical protein